MNGCYNDRKYRPVFNRADNWVLYVICTLFIRIKQGESSSFAIVVEGNADSTSMMSIILPYDLLAF